MKNSCYTERPTRFFAKRYVADKLRWKLAKVFCTLRFLMNLIFFPYNGVQPFLFAVHEDDLQSVMCVACKDCYESVKKVFNNFN